MKVHVKHKLKIVNNYGIASEMGHKSPSKAPQKPLKSPSKAPHQWGALAVAPFEKKLLQPTNGRTRGLMKVLKF